MNSTLTAEQQHAIEAFLKGRKIVSGLGTKEAACSVAAINLALTGELTDTIPACMSEVIGTWVIAVQDAMPAKMRNSTRWRNLLPLAAGSGRQMEGERMAIILQWMWETVLPYVQPVADRGGFGRAWAAMCDQKTASAARTAAKAAKAAVKAAAKAERPAEAWEASAAEAAAKAAGVSAKAAAWEASSGAVFWARMAAGAGAGAWAHFDPCALLESLLGV